MSRVAIRHLSQAFAKKHPFTAFSKWVAGMAGHPAGFSVAFLLILLWAAMGPLFDFSTQWQLIVNSGTTIATFLMVFLIQNTQNRDAAAMHIKLDELIRSDSEAHNALMDLEELTEKELLEIKAKYEKLAREAREDLRRGKKDEGIPEV